MRVAGEVLLTDELLGMDAEELRVVLDAERLTRGRFTLEEAAEREITPEDERLMPGWEAHWVRLVCPYDG